jgi:kynurenine 3-monooxygenase
LVGDATHAFPPDIGQGINAGFQDVVVMDRSFRGYLSKYLDVSSVTMQPSAIEVDENTTLSSALHRYQENRFYEHKALIRLARFGSPYQYRQPWLRDRIGRFLWSINVALRQVLHQVSGGIIPPVAILLLSQRLDLTYRHVMRRADWTCRSMKAILWVLLFSGVRRFVTG